MTRDTGPRIVLLIGAALLAGSGYLAWTLSDMSTGTDPARYARFQQSLSAPGDAALSLPAAP